MIYALPVIFIIIFGYAFIKNIPAYDYFVLGAKEAFNLCLSIFPYLASIFIFVELLNASFLGDYICTFFEPVLNFLKIPTELSELILLRPFSGNGSLAIVESIFNECGPDSYAGRCASVVVGASDTVFYVVAVYFSTIKIKHLRYILPVCLIACAFGSVMACVLVRLFMRI